VPHAARSEDCIAFDPGTGRGVKVGGSKIEGTTGAASLVEHRRRQRRASTATP
jgi:hypothetical protein